MGHLDVYVDMYHSAWVVLCMTYPSASPVGNIMHNNRTETGCTRESNTLYKKTIVNGERFFTREFDALYKNSNSERLYKHLATLAVSRWTRRRDMEYPLSVFWEKICHVIITGPRCTLIHYIRVTSNDQVSKQYWVYYGACAQWRQWAHWRFKSPATPQFVQQHI